MAARELGMVGYEQYYKEIMYDQFIKTKNNEGSGG